MEIRYKMLPIVAAVFGLCCLAAHAANVQPEDISVVPGMDVEFTVDQAGAATYEWKKVGSPAILGTAQTLVIHDVDNLDEGEYLCLVDGVPTVVNGNLTVYNKVVHWGFNQVYNASEPDRVIDLSGNGLDGTLVPDANIPLLDAFEWSADGGGHTGQPGDSALRLFKTWDGNDPNLFAFHKVHKLNVDSNSLPGADIFLGATRWTLNVWVKYEEHPGDAVNIAGFGDCEWDPNQLGEYRDRYLLSDGGGGYSARFGTGPGVTVNSVGNITDGQWHMLTFSYNPNEPSQYGDQSIYRVYLDGVFRYSGLTAFDDVLFTDRHFIINSGGLMSGQYIGENEEGDPDDNDFQGIPFYGWVDDYCIIDGTLSQSQIDFLYQGYQCLQDIPGDVNGDCKVDLIDFQGLASSWLDCELIPATACSL